MQKAKKSPENNMNDDGNIRVSCGNQRKFDCILEKYNNLDDITLWMKVTRLGSFLKNIHLLKNLESLTFRYLKLDTIPFDPEFLPNLKRLKLSLNSFKTLPEGILKLKNLEILNLSQNKLTKLPDNFVNLSKIKRLNLSYNNFSVIPKCISSLFNLEFLDLSYNELDNSSFITQDTNTFGSPIEIEEDDSTLFKSSVFYENIKYISETALFEFPQKIRSLNLSSNKLQDIPLPLSKLKNLKRLDLSSNNLKLLNDSFCDLTDLKTLNLDKNQIRSLPNEMDKLHNLRKLNLEENLFTKVPEVVSRLHGLVELDLSYNNLVEVSVRHLKCLKKLQIFIFGFMQPKFISWGNK